MKALSIIIVLLTCCASALQAQPQFRDSVEIHKTDTVYFGFGQADLMPQTISALDGFYQNRKPGLELYLEGHTDAVGSAAANDRLSRERAENVANYLRGLGWAADSIRIMSFGESKLAVSTQHKEERNRRVFLRSGIPQQYRLFRGRAVDSLGIPLPASVIAHGRYLSDSTVTDQDGYFDLWLPVDQTVGLNIYAKGYLFFSQYFKIDGTEEQEDFSITLQAAKPGARMDVPDLFFVGNSTELLPQGKKALERLYYFLQFDPDIRVELAGHVNHRLPFQQRGTFSYKLSEGRAKYIMGQMVLRGIHPDRMVAKWYSNHEMRYPNPKNQLQQIANRRVEIRVLE